MTRRRVQSGFTFIELLSVVVIIGILTVIMLPNVKNYQAKTKVSEAVMALTNCRTSVSEIYVSGGPIPPDDWGCDTNYRSQYVDQIQVSPDGIITVRTSALLGDTRVAIKDISLAPLNRSGQVMNNDDAGDPVFRWRCGAISDGTDSDLAVIFLPSSCRGV
jgi:type IV pilus assembly protein PilA